jgi:DME family drug/metabolite transporter
VLAGAILWGTTGASQELLQGAFSPIIVGALRAVLGGGLLVAVAIPGARRSAPALLASRNTLLLAAAAVLTYQFTFFTGVSELGVAVGTILAVGSAPFFAGAASILLGRHRPSRQWVGTTVLAVFGLVLLMSPGGEVTPSISGVLAALSAGLSFGLYTVLAKDLLDRGVRRLDTVAVPFLLGGLLSLPVLFVGLSGGRGAVLLELRVLAVIAWLAIAATAGGYLLFVSGLGSVPAVVGATLVLVEPLTAALLGVSVFGERLGPVSIVGAGAVALALLITAREPEPEGAR